ncbi:rRNA methyltransferase 1, mitochondrial-like isoform X2 [Mya arenaria]|uniref:rRNA methyltransferase 1, mitochondrial-like isoform X2 n=1 Tax=Mya arenaria TaxID=6604 RepID=UPI0022E7568A|nr:rRNA methyltransferase 1, mitochondrial-like isoform X2 [Mya arenaria]
MIEPFGCRRMTYTVSRFITRCMSQYTKEKAHNTPKKLNKGIDKHRGKGQRIPLPEVHGEVLWGIHPVSAALQAGKRQIHQALFQGVCLDVSARMSRFIDVNRDINRSSLTDIETGEPSVWVLPYRVVDTMNMGAILRSTHFFGADKVLLPSYYSASLNAVVSKASAGAMEVLDFLRLQDESQLEFALQKWRDAGGVIVGSTSNKEHSCMVPLHQFTADKPILLLIGNEATGLPDAICQHCDVLLYIGGHTFTSADHWHVSSLNVSVATGILLHSIMQTRLKTNR